MTLRVKYRIGIITAGEDVLSVPYVRGVSDTNNRILMHLLDHIQVVQTVATAVCNTLNAVFNRTAGRDSLAVPGDRLTVVQNLRLGLGRYGHLTDLVVNQTVTTLVDRRNRQCVTINAVRNQVEVLLAVRGRPFLALTDSHYLSRVRNGSYLQVQRPESGDMSLCIKRRIGVVSAGLQIEASPCVRKIQFADRIRVRHLFNHIQVIYAVATAFGYTRYAVFYHTARRDRLAVPGDRLTGVQYLRLGLGR